MAREAWQTCLQQLRVQAAGFDNGRRTRLVERHGHGVLAERHKREEGLLLASTVSITTKRASRGAMPRTHLVGHVHQQERYKVQQALAVGQERNVRGHSNDHTLQSQLATNDDDNDK